MLTILVKTLVLFFKVQFRITNVFVARIPSQLLYVCTLCALGFSSKAMLPGGTHPMSICSATPWTCRCYKKT